jgi:general secretion pathway protein C
MKNLIKIIFIIVLSTTTQFTRLEAAGESGSGTLSGASMSNLTLKGTLFTRSLNPLAIIEDAGSEQIIMYELGDDINGLRIMRIRRGEITLSSQGEEYKLSFPDGGVFQNATPVNKDEKWYHIAREGNTIITNRETISGAISRVRDIMRNVKIRPYSANGKKCGIAVTAFNEEGILKEMGIKQGDIIKSVNGLTLNSPYQIFSAYRKLRGKDELAVEIIRKNNPLLLTYRVKK